MKDLNMRVLYSFVLFLFFCLSSGIAAELMTPEDHVGFLKSSLAGARNQVVVVSPYISKWALGKGGGDSIVQHIRSARERGVNVIVFTDENFDKDAKTNQLKEPADEGRKMLVTAGVDLRVVPRIHSKNVIVDGTCITFGSFNWLSAVTNPENEFCRFETSLVRRGQEAGDAIESFKLGLLRTLPPSARSAALPLDAEDELKSAIALYQKYRTHPSFGELAQNILVSHAYNYDLREGLLVLRTIKGTSSTAVIVNIAEYLLWYAETSRDFVRIAWELHDVAPVKAKETVQYLIRTINRSDEYDNFDFIYGQLTAMGMPELANKLEEVLIFGAPRDF